MESLLRKKRRLSSVRGLFPNRPEQKMVFRKPAYELARILQLLFAIFWNITAIQNPERIPHA
jgi:hypothetical protein